MPNQLSLLDYPHTPGWKRTDTSKAAAMSIKAATIRAKVLAVIKDKPMTADEVADVLVVSRLSVRPRLLTATG